MEMKKIGFWLIAISAMCLWGEVRSQAQTPQQPAEKQREVVTRVVDVKYVDPIAFLPVLEPFKSASGAFVSPSQTMKTLTLSGTPEIVAAMEAVVRKLDVAPPPEKSFEVTAHLLMTSDSASSSQSMPTQLEPVLKQLRATFNYKNYQLLDTLVLRNRIGAGGHTSEEIPDPGFSDHVINCGLAYSHSQLTHDDRGDIIKLTELDLILGKGRINTSIDLRVGQMVVVGKTNFAVGNSALIAVLSAKVVD
jgi:hypothetical protein